MTVDEFPEHIKALHKRLEEQKELDSVAKDIDFDICKLRLYCNYPHRHAISESKIYMNNDSTLNQILQKAYSVGFSFFTVFIFILQVIHLCYS